jgi:plasmid segregation protein ParM
VLPYPFSLSDSKGYKMPTNKRSSQLQTAAPLANTITIGLDIGYGATKAVIGNQTIVFPSVCGHAHEIKFKADEIAMKYPGDRLTDDEGAWFVGDLATSQVNEGELIRLRGRTADEATIGNVFRARMAKTAIGKLLAGTQHWDVVHLRVGTGLPVDHMPDADGLRSALVGQHAIKTDVTSFIANVSEVMVMPQPYGTLYSEMMLSDGSLNPHYTVTRTGVVDVGTYTVDVTTDDDGEYIERESGSVEGGVYTAQQRIAALLERQYREKPSHRLVEETLRTGYARIRGESVDYREAVASALASVRDATLNLMSAKWKTGATLDAIFVTGGGAELVETAVTAAYPQARVVKQAQTANARGYLNYALFKALQA